jgi:flagellar protein FlaG
MTTELPGIANSGYPLADGTATKAAKWRANSETETRATAKDLTALTRQVAQVLQVDSQNVQFSMDDSTGKVLVKVVDAKTKLVLRQIPSEEMVEIAKSLDAVRGLLINAQA